MLTQKNKKGSALVFALIIMSMMLTIAMSLSSVAVMQKKNAGSTQYSVQAYQAADGVSQLALKTINNSLNSLDLTQRTLGASFATIATCNTSTGVVTFSTGFGADTTMELSFFDDATPTPVQLRCNDFVDNVSSIHAVAQHLNSVRAIDLAVERD